MGKNRHPDAMYAISEQEICWVACLHRRQTRLLKSFAFSMYGGRDAALRAAQAWRDQAVQNNPTMLRREKAEKPQSNNTTGYPGVFCIFKPDGSVERWIAKTLVAKGRLLQKSFSFGRYGDEAKTLAIAERQNQLELMQGRLCLHPASVVMDKLAMSLPALVQPVISREQVVRSDNQTGMAGVCLSRDPDMTPRAWIASTQMSPGKRVLKEFSCLVHGEEKARQLAIEERERQLLRKQGLVENIPAETADPAVASTARPALSRPRNGGTNQSLPAADAPESCAAAYLK